jgi:dipeptidase
VEVHTTERTRHFLMKKPKKILQLRLEDKNVFNAIHLNSIGYVFEFGEGCGFTAVRDAVEDYGRFDEQGINSYNVAMSSAESEASNRRVFDGSQ